MSMAARRGMMVFNMDKRTRNVKEKRLDPSPRIDLVGHPRPAPPTYSGWELRERARRRERAWYIFNTVMIVILLIMCAGEALALILIPR